MLTTRWKTRKGRSPAIKIVLSDAWGRRVPQQSLRKFNREAALRNCLSQNARGHECAFNALPVLSLQLRNKRSRRRPGRVPRYTAFIGIKGFRGMSSTRMATSVLASRSALTMCSGMCPQPRPARRNDVLRAEIGESPGERREHSVIAAFGQRRPIGQHQLDMLFDSRPREGAALRRQRMRATATVAKECRATARRASLQEPGKRADRARSVQLRSNSGLITPPSASTYSRSDV